MLLVLAMTCTVCVQCSSACFQLAGIVPSGGQSFLMFLMCPWLFPLYMCFSSLRVRQGKSAGILTGHAFLVAHHE